MTLLLRLVCLLFFLLQSQLTFSLQPSSSTQLCPPNQRDALLQFKNSLDYPSDSKIASWKANTDCCSWNGTTCDAETGHLIGLDLNSSELDGIIDSNSSLFLLSHLQKLNLAFNYFYFSNIPSEIGEFVHLTHLNLSNSLFSGPVPLEITYLSSLVSLDLTSTPYFLKLEMPTLERLVQNLTELRELYLDWVDMSPAEPRFLTNLSSTLTALSLVYCKLYGRFPNNILHLPNLQTLVLEGNQELTGYLPKSNWSSPLRYLDLSLTNFLGDLPDSIGNLKSLGTLHLFESNFEGSIPESLGTLTQIIDLDLSSMTLTGSIPKSLGNLTQITYLDLSNNNFTGSIPKSLENLTQITSLDLSHNSFSGSIPVRLGDLVQVTHLDLSFNNFNGDIPSSFSNLKELANMNLQQNNLAGRIPDLTNLTQLSDLLLSNNQLVGFIPSHTYGLLSIEYVDLSDNLLKGSIPSWLLTSPSLAFLKLHNNQLSGQIDEFHHDSSLVYLTLNNNSLCGRIPHSISKLVNLFWLDLSSNNFTGVVEFDMFLELEQLSYLDSLLLSFTKNVNHTLPTLKFLGLSFCNISEFPYFLRTTLEKITHLDLSNNKIRDHIPEWVFDVGESLNYLNLGHNLLTGWIPSLICNKSNIEFLILSYNNLSGLIPQCLGRFSVLDLRMNRFRGIIPNTFKSCDQLTTVNFNGNQLEGELPHSLVNCERLEVLDIGNNKITDSFPHWLEALPNLTVLILRSNRFHGPISNSKTSIPFQKLRILDLSYNEFNGLLPKTYFEKLRAMMILDEGESERHYMGNDYQQDSEGIAASGLYIKFVRIDYYQDSVVVTMKGLNIELVRILTVFTTIDLSCNQFQGRIPRQLGRLNFLRVLNLSHNSLTDQIPWSLGNLTLLESLDLSSNRLTGQIPMELANLTFLEVLNLSQNQLVGPIPLGKQFGTFENSSYGGNLGLCGFPLSQKCSTHEPPPPPSLSTFQEDNGSLFACGFGWKAVLMGYCCGLVFGVAMGYLMFKTRKPQWLVRLVEGERHRKSRKPNQRRRGRRN